jgi:phosphoribosylformimino-5-aminoimidazole carboxamide ribonucleotide (ProFAR) isomerase
MQQATTIPVVCSGGVTTLADIDQLLTMNTHAAIVGRAIYEGQLDLVEVLRRCPQRLPVSVAANDDFSDSKHPQPERKP